MPVKESGQAAVAALADAELTKLYADTGIDLSMLPAVIKPEELAPVIGTSVSGFGPGQIPPHRHSVRQIRPARALSSRGRGALSGRQPQRGPLMGVFPDRFTERTWRAGWCDIRFQPAGGAPTTRQR